ncbi:MAG: HD-GYP domain-containing protein [Phycisphaerae bacterium]
MTIQRVTDDQAIMQSLLKVGGSFTSTGNSRQMLARMLREARKLLRAEAGSLYVLCSDRLRLMAVQNDRHGDQEAARSCLGEEISLGDDRLPAFVARMGMVMNVPDARSLPEGAPFRVDLTADARSGYWTRSVLAVPLQTNGECKGVVELVNRVGPAGEVLKFPAEELPKTEALASVMALAIHNIQLQQQLKTAHMDTIIRLSVAAEYRDDDSAAHIRRISRGSAVLARAVGLGRSEVELLEYASPMHDIGKIGIPDSILRKPGALTPEERDIMQTHTVIGGKILEDPRTDLITLAREVAMSHHERWDGLGYPRGLGGEDIPLPARLVAIVDVFDALLAKRCYKEAYSLEKALDIITREKGKHFDPEVTEAFLANLDDLLNAFRQNPDEAVRIDAVPNDAGSAA